MILHFDFRLFAVYVVTPKQYDIIADDFMEPRFNLRLGRWKVYSMRNGWRNMRDLETVTREAYK